MAKYLAILLTVGAAALPVALPAAASAQTTTVDPAVDTPAQRRILKNLTACIARLRPGWARNALSHPYLSREQATAAGAVVSGRDNCLGPNEVEVVFRTSTMIGSLAEHFVVTELPRVDFPGVTRTLARLEPRNASEDFALCVASRDPTAARDLVASEVGSSRETAAGQRFTQHIDFCTNPGEDLTVDLQSLRAMVAIALYRSLPTTVASR